jgi:hypothetical protein
LCGSPVGDAARAKASLPIIPTFVLPYKRYAWPNLLRLSADYLEDDQQSYREVASPNGRRRAHKSPPGTPPKDARGLFDHSTVWRMLAWLGGQLAALANGREQILQHAPQSTCHRFAGVVAPHKFRSPQRERILRRSRQLIYLMVEWDERFPTRFFPRFATRSGFD